RGRPLCECKRRSKRRNTLARKMEGSRWGTMLGRRVIGRIEPTAVVGPRVKLGVNNYIGHYTVIEGDVTLGDNNYIGSHCVIGAAAQNSVHRYEIDDEHDCAERIVIGSNNVVREFTTMHRPMVDVTRINDRCYLMAYNHV